MSKRPKAKTLQAGERIDLDSSVKLDPVPDPEPRRFMPRDCTLCATRRKPGESYARVYAKVGKIRYCKCGLCGHTWAQEGE